MIKNIKWNSHDVLGDLELSFSKADGSAYNTIILAGENGAGKTTILETLSTFLNLGSFEPFQYIKYVVDDVPYTIFVGAGDSSQYGFHSRRNEGDGTVKRILTNRSNSPKQIEDDNADIRHYGCAYSKARSGFNTSVIKSSTTSQLDSTKYEDDTKDDFTQIKQLIVDIDTQDKSDWMAFSQSQSQSGKTIAELMAEFDANSKMYRFKKAFNNFFDKIKFIDVDNTDPNEKKIIFEKNGKRISIDNLSTGEKQIVFRGAHLLKNVNGINGGIVLIDEPELSMHPRWQEKILEYYRSLFTNEGEQKVQIIIATHSEYVLRSALKDRDNILIIALNDVDGSINSRNITAPSVLPTITAAETNYIAFDIASIDYHIELYGYLQRKNGDLSVKKCDEYIMNQTNIFDQSLHYKESSYTAPDCHVTEYFTLPTYIRNAIDHPDPSKPITPEALRCSIELLIKLCK